MALSKYKRKICFAKWLKNPKCFVCKKRIKYFVEASAEHIIPLSLGGKTNSRNLTVSHSLCNMRRGNIICPVIWIRKLGITFKKEKIYKPKPKPKRKVRPKLKRNQFLNEDDYNY